MEHSKNYKKSVKSVKKQRDQVYFSPEELNINKSLDLIRCIPVLRELTNVVVKLLSMIFEKPWQSGETLGGWQKGSIALIFKMGEKGTLGTADLLA